MQLNQYVTGVMKLKHYEYSSLVNISIPEYQTCV